MPPKVIQKTTRQTSKKEDSQSQQSIFELNENEASNENIWDFMKKIHDSQVFISKQNDDIILKLENITKENEILRKNQEMDRSIINNLKKEVDELKYHLGEIEQKELNKSININGLPQLNDEEQIKTITEIAHELNFDFDASEITKISKMENERLKSVDYSFEFKNEKIRSMFLMKRKEKKIFINSAKNIFSLENNNMPNAKRIYINEQLTKSNFNLFNHAKSLKQHGYNYVWYKFGKIFVRKTGNSNIHIIRSVKMIDNLINDLPTTNSN